MKSMKIGFIGQGWIGKNYADDFENRGYKVVRYALEEPYVKNKDLIAECDIVFIAVPTPTTPAGFDDSYLHATIPLVGVGMTAVIKSTMAPGTTVKFQNQYPDRVIFHSPEFLVEKTAAYNAAHPDRNIIGIPLDTDEYRKKAEIVMEHLPDAPYKKIMSAKDAEVVKYKSGVHESYL
jgi:UDP-glucose 6-dehydrogenase